MRQALAGMLWSKQFYYYDVDHGSRSIERPRLRSPTRDRETSTGATSGAATSSRCPTSGSTPGIAAWDLAFHCVASAWSTGTSPRTR